MEYIDNLKHMYTSSCNTVDIRRCVNIQRMYTEKAVINAYKDIFMEVLSIKYNNHPGISKNPLDIDKYLHDSYDRLVKRQNAIRQYEHCAGTDLTLVPGVYENEQLIVKKMWYYNEATLIRLERFVDYNQYDVAKWTAGSSPDWPSLYETFLHRPSGQIAPLSPRRHQTPSLRPMSA